MGDINIQKLKAITGHFDPEMMFKVPLAKIGNILLLYNYKK
jgi:hypothetical protein